MRETGLGEVPTREPWAIRAGLVAGALTLVLRLVGVVVGPVAIALAVLAIVLLPGPEWWADRFLIAAVAIFGWFPVLGWIPKLGRKVDLEGILLAVAVGFAVAHQVAVRRRRTGDEPRDRSRWIKPSEVLALLVSLGVTLWWAIPLLGKSAAGRLRLLLPGWDNPTHLSFLRLNLKLGSFVTVEPNSPAGDRIYGAEYPQGWHQAWQQMVRLWYRHPPTSSRSLVNIYSIALVLTAGFAVLIGCMAVARLCRERAFMALPSMALVAQLLAVGVLSMTVWFGFPNFGIAVIAVAVAPSMLMRQSLRAPASFFVVSGLMLIATYNWWPLGLLVVPPLGVATWRLWQHAGVAGRRPYAVAAIVVAALATLAPIGVTLHLGASHLRVDGGIPPTPWWLVFALALALIAAVALRQAVVGESLVTFVLGVPAVLATVGLIGVMAYDISSPETDTVGYYGQKMGSAVAAFAAVGLALLLADALSRVAPRIPAVRSRTVYVGVAAIIASAAVFQLSGYVGPRQKTVAGAQAAPGFLTREQWSQFDGTLNPLAVTFLDAVDATRRRTAQTGEFNENFAYVDIEGLHPVRPDWTDLWFSALAGDLTTPRLDRSWISIFTALNQVTDPATAASALTQQFPPGASSVRLIVPDSMIAPMVQLGWTVGTNVFPRSVSWFATSFTRLRSRAFVHASGASSFTRAAGRTRAGARRSASVASSSDPRTRR